MKNVTKKFLALVLVLNLLSGCSIMFSFASFPLKPDEVIGVDLLMQLTKKKYDAYDAHIMQQVQINNNSANLLYIPWANKIIISPENCKFNANYDFELDCPVQNSTPVLVPARGVHRTTDDKIDWCKINTSKGNIWIPKFMAIPNENLLYHLYYFDETKGCYRLVEAIFACEGLNYVYVYFNFNIFAFCYSEFFSIPPVTFQ